MRNEGLKKSMKYQNTDVRFLLMSMNYSQLEPYLTQSHGIENHAAYPINFDVAV